MTGPPEVVRLARELGQLRENAGNPKYAAMGKRAADAGFAVATSSLSIADKGNHLPGLRVVQAYVVGCKGDPDQWEDRWTEANAAVQGKESAATGTRPPRQEPHAGRPAPPDPTSAATPEQLRDRLRTLYERAGRPSLRDMESAAAELGLRLPRSTSQNLLRSTDAGALPRRDHLRTFLAVCGLPEDDHDTWVAVRDAMDERRRQRVQARRATVTVREPAVDPPPAAPGPRPAVVDPLPAARVPAQRTEPVVGAVRTVPRRNHRWPFRVASVLVGGALLFVLASSTVAGDIGDPPVTPPPPLVVVPEPLTLARPGAAPPARRTLLALIDRIRANPPTPAPGTGRYTYVYTRIWSLDTIDPAVVSAPVDQHLWWAADGSARRVGRTVETFGPGDFTLLEPPVDDPVILAGQFDNHQPLQNGPQSTIRAVADMHKQHPFTPDQIAAALRVLADTDGLVDRGLIIDRANRPGIAVSVDSDAGATRDVAVFDPRNGALLSYERVALISPARTPVRAPAVIAYVLFLKHSRTNQPA